MAKRPPTLFTVEGNGQFPYDMLRYDACWPTSARDADNMHGNDGDYGRLRRISLTSARDPWMAPTSGRWKSFGWRVVT